MCMMLEEALEATKDMISEVMWRDESVLDSEGEMPGALAKAKIDG